MIGLIVVLLTFFWDSEGDFSTVGVVILGNRCGIQGQNYVALLQHYSRGVVELYIYNFVGLLTRTFSMV